MPVAGYFGGRGRTVLRKMKERYGDEEGERVFYATAKKRGQEPKTEWVQTSGGLMEFRGMGGGGGSGKVNAPTFAYKTVYGSAPSGYLSGRTDAPKKSWGGHQVDVGLKNRWLDELDRLPVEIRSTEEGKSEERPAFVIFRMPKGEDDMADAMAAKLRQYPATYSRAEVGQGGRPRICVAGKIWNTSQGWQQWWDKLPGRIAKAYNEITPVKEWVQTSGGLMEKKSYHKTKRKRLAYAAKIGAVAGALGGGIGGADYATGTGKRSTVRHNRFMQQQHKAMSSMERGLGMDPGKPYVPQKSPGVLMHTVGGAAVGSMVGAGLGVGAEYLNMRKERQAAKLRRRKAVKRLKKNEECGIIHRGAPDTLPGQMVGFSQLTEAKKKGPMQKLKANRVKLDPKERAEVMERGAVWHHGPNGEKTPGVWKSKDPKTGKCTYVCNTHRAMQAKPTLKGAINAFKFIKTTA